MLRLGKMRCIQVTLRESWKEAREWSSSVPGKVDVTQKAKITRPRERVGAQRWEEAQAHVLYRHNSHLSIGE